MELIVLRGLYRPGRRAAGTSLGGGPVNHGWHAIDWQRPAKCKRKYIIAYSSCVATSGTSCLCVGWLSRFVCLKNGSCASLYQKIYQKIILIDLFWFYLCQNMDYKIYYYLIFKVLHIAKYWPYYPHNILPDMQIMWIKLDLWCLKIV